MENPTLGFGPLNVGKSEICRLCMKTHAYYLNIFVAYEEFTMSIGKAIEDLLVLTVAKDDNLPKMVCCPCVTKLMEFREFKEMCMNSAREFGRHAPVEPITCPLECEGMPVRLMDGGEGADVEKKSPNRNEACDPLAFDNLCPVKEEFLPMQLCGEATSGMWSNSVDGESRLPVAQNDLSLDSFAPENQTDTKEVFPRDPLGESDDCGEENFAETHFNEDAAVYNESKQLLTVDQVDHQNNIGCMTKEPEKESDKCDADRKRNSQNKELNNFSSSPTHEENSQLKYPKPNSFAVDCFSQFSQLNDSARPVRDYECELLGHQAENASYPTEYICNYCNTGYSEIYSLALHIKMHVDGMRSASVLPDKKFSPIFSQNLLVKEFKCIKCEKTFSSSSELNTHSVVHNDVKRFKCNECGKMFAQSGTLKSHSLIHTGVKPFKCNDCGKMFTLKGNLKSHLLVHTGVKQFKCNECGKTFSRKGHLNEHSFVHTGVKRFKCNECGMMFTQSGTLKTHSLTHTDVKTFKCNDCGKMFSRICDLRSHSIVHTGVKRVKCDECGKTFTTSSKLKSHSVIHTGVKSFKCNECGKMFSRSNDLRTHSVVHTGVRPFKCNECGKTFTTSSNLKSHSVIHTGVKPFKCDLCGKQFKWRSGFSRHLLLHVDRNPSK